MLIAYTAIIHNYFCVHKRLLFVCRKENESSENKVWQKPGFCRCTREKVEPLRINRAARLPLWRRYINVVVEH